ncbi:MULTISPECIES: hypothetical protein [unclassified Streptomyces]|uniref:hypothetical protein n=1 Tax=unclassified Streptomyces TaxID=2593676 RepID=UPI000748EBD2|nr:MULTISPECIES: hypothetical protein [unclassified Streptomyces]KUL69413.1 hypothetical protein ADL33_31000 [Streptomyces sp. NRRL WC-3604]KUL70027.1 hypothetical protein ADL34_28650 [Streptomyces sp. NRRL WC-3605]
MEPVADDGEDRLNADIEEFATHDRKGGWARALLIARRVEPDGGHGVGFDQESTKRFDRTVFRRISAREFARRSHTSHKRVMAFHEAWKRAAADGIVPPLHDLTPGVHVDLPDEEERPFFGERGYYRSYEARMNAGERRQAIEQEAERAGLKPGSPVYVAQQPKALKTAILADPTARAAAKEAIEEFERREARADLEDRAAARQTAEESDCEFDAGEVHEDYRARDAEAVEVERAVRATSREQSEPDVALQVFTEMTEVRLGTLRALSLLQRNQVQFTGDRSRAIAELCDASQAAMAFIRDLAASRYTALNDDALQAFLDESEKKLG